MCCEARAVLSMLCRLQILLRTVLACAVARHVRLFARCVACRYYYALSSSARLRGKCACSHAVSPADITTHCPCVRGCEARAVVRSLCRLQILQRTVLVCVVVRQMRLFARCVACRYYYALSLRARL